MTHNSANDRHEQRPNSILHNSKSIFISYFQKECKRQWRQNYSNWHLRHNGGMASKFCDNTQIAIVQIFTFYPELNMRQLRIYFFHIYLLDWLSSLCHVYRVSITNQLVPAIVTVRLNWYDWMCLMLMHIHGAEHSVHCKSYMFVIENNFYWIHHR